MAASKAGSPSQRQTFSGGFETEFGEPGEPFVMGLGAVVAIEAADAVKDGVERALGDDAGDRVV